jgi:DNA-binding MarR family transcriptional regulator
VQRDDLSPALAARLGFLLKHSQLRLRALHEPALAPLDLDGRQFAVLDLVAAEGPRSQQQLGERMRVDRTTMVSLIDQLERKGLVERRRREADRRAYDVRVTEAGERVLEEARGAIEAAEREFLAPLSADDAQRLRELLGRLIT